MHLRGRPWKWQKLAHVCKTWRSVLLASSHYLDLRLLFTDGMPVREILSSWPVLPIVMQYVREPGSSPLTPSDQDNIMTLLELPTRLREVQLTVTTPLLERVTILMQQPFSVLEYLHLSALPGLVLPSKFGGGMRRLRTLRMVGIALPALPQLLLSAHDLVYLQLENLPSVGYTSEALVICLPAMTQLKTLRIHFLCPTSLPILISTDRALPGYSVLPSLNFIEFHGTNEYLESLFSGISAPLLEHFHIDFFNQLIFDTPQLSRFIHRTEMQQLHTHATIRCSVADISITLTQLEVQHQLSLRILCKQLDWQIPSMAEVCDKLAPSLVNVEQLKISTSAYFPDEQDDIDLIHSDTLELLRPFRNVKRLCVTEASLSLVAGALGPVTGELAIVALPELQEIQMENHTELASAQIAFAPFIAARQLSTHPVVVCSAPVKDLRSTSPMSTPPPLPEVAFSPPTYLHPVLATPNLQYDMRYHPNHSNLRLSPAIFAAPASSPPLPSLSIRVAGLPWDCVVRPDPETSSGDAVVTVQDILVCLYFHLRTAVKVDEYIAMSSARKEETVQALSWSIGRDQTQPGPGESRFLRRIDFLGSHIIAEGLLSTQLQGDVWDVIVR
ncbi:hypothetical protein EDB83DRAFT_2356601 [Lactarius deliciosus]|nr:hypothetical protein EDB83DRAFT_2356601 [Lactarius deliciosus]